MTIYSRKKGTNPDGKKLIKQSIGKADFVRDFGQIKKLIARGYTYNQVAKLYKVSVHWVRELLKGA